jgi:hypothetical protein
MINFRIYEILSTFSKKDWNDFKRFVKSFDTTSKRKYFPLLLELKKYSKRIKALENIPVSEIFEKAYKRKTGNRTISNRQSEFLYLIKKFLGNIENAKKKLTETNFYFDELLSRNLLDIFSYEYNRKKNDIIEKNIYNENSYKTISEIIGKYITCSVLRNENYIDDITKTYFKYSDIILADITINLFQTAFELQMLKDYGFKNDNSLLNLIDSLDSDKLIKELESQNKPIFVLPITYYYIFKSLKETHNSIYLSKAKKMFFENETYFQEKFRIYIYSLFMSCYIKRNNKGENCFKDLFLLFKRKLRQNIVSDITKYTSLDNSIFREYIITGLEVKEYKWVEMVINKYSPLLPIDVREDEYTLAISKLYFAKKEYRKTADTINNYKIKNSKYIFDLMKLKLISNYELEEFEECYKEIDNVRHYCKNNRTKFLPGTILHFKNFLDVFSKLLNYRINPFKNDTNDILYEFEKSNISKKSWIYEKLREISEKQK